MPDFLTIDQISQRTGESHERLRDWQSAGLIGTEDPEVYLPTDVGRAKLVHDLLHYGVDFNLIANAIKSRDSVFTAFLDQIGQKYVRDVYSIQEASEMIGLDLALAKRLVETAGIGEHGDMYDESDLEFFRSCKVTLDAGMPEEALSQILRVYSDAMSRAAEVGSRTSHFYMHQPLKEQGLPSDEIMRRLNEAGSQIEPLVEPALRYFHKKGMERSAWEDMMMHLEEEAGLAEKPQTPGQIRRAIMFVDLASFTPLAEAMGDLRAARVLDRFGQMVRKAVARCHGRIVKQIGDAFMIVFPECYSAVSCGLELEERSSHEAQFPAVRVGLHWGPVLYHEGDYIGSNVNIASRLATEAHRHQFLLTDEVRRRAKSYEYAEFIRLGRRRLKGLAAEVDVYEARAVEPSHVDKTVDPVCGMELGKGEVAARLTRDGKEHVFCSDDCLSQFVRAPERYLGAS